MSVHSCLLAATQVKSSLSVNRKIFVEGPRRTWTPRASLYRRVCGRCCCHVHLCHPMNIPQPRPPREAPPSPACRTPQRLGTPIRDGDACRAVRCSPPSPTGCMHLCKVLGSMGTHSVRWASLGSGRRVRRACPTGRETAARGRCVCSPRIYAAGDQRRTRQRSRPAFVEVGCGRTRGAPKNWLRGLTIRTTVALEAATQGGYMLQVADHCVLD